jgi:ubiquinone/menaquinone biosynthesis C-methylase UbiE
VDQQLRHHYTRLAQTYDDTWAHRPEYLDWMTEHIEGRLRPRPGDRIGDIGAGTGLFVRRLMAHATERTPLVCVDPTEAMLAQLPRSSRLHPVLATAEDLAQGHLDVPYDAFDALVIKETVHHFADLTTTMAGLADRLADGGRLLVVTLPAKLEYPLFQAALDQFAAGQPEPETVADAMRGAGLAVTTEFEEFPVSLARDRWLRLVANRWMSVLSTFTDTELDRGLGEIAEHHPDARLDFTDRFAFVLGRRAG